jgi:hypothetical protein
MTTGASAASTGGKVNWLKNRGGRSTAPSGSAEATTGGNGGNGGTAGTGLAFEEIAIPIPPSTISAKTGNPHSKTFFMRKTIPFFVKWKLKTKRKRPGFLSKYAWQFSLV